MLRRQSKVIAVFLLLIFSEKAGLRLWMHHWFHESKTAAGSKIAARSGATPAAETIQLSCDCFNEAMLPIEESALITFAIPTQTITELATAPQLGVPDAGKVYYSLKGPPISRFRS